MEKENRKTIREIGIRDVISWMFISIAVLIFILSGIVTIQAGQFFIGLLFFVPVVFIAVPKKFLKIKMSKALKIVILIIVYFILLVVSGLDAPMPEQQYENYNLKQPFDLTFGDNVFSMNIDSISKETEINVDGEDISSSGYFLFVNGSVTNLGKVPLDFDLQSELRDSQDNLYTVMALKSNLDMVQPNLARNFSCVFEIPKEISGLKFIMKDKTNVYKTISLE